eukprot:CAMPEP_0179336356 /NCGR_PEP_ID=MMETSP0797-20121207/66997_1 /TAXON_ID=47934 /ORGANISM="Dinophysis acuminata, Strain DAEP01" /LENGTH=244 /DNA_ID=CAMNT_0021049833 /DNA_START=277 /DNA_END=1012 /DNA_ORIENTATION=-
MRRTLPPSCLLPRRVGSRDTLRRLLPPAVAGPREAQPATAPARAVEPCEARVDKHKSNGDREETAAAYDRHTPAIEAKRGDEDEKVNAKADVVLHNRPGLLGDILVALPLARLPPAPLEPRHQLPLQVVREAGVDDAEHGVPDGDVARVAAGVGEARGRAGCGGGHEAPGEDHVAAEGVAADRRPQVAEGTARLSAARAPVVAERARQHADLLAGCEDVDHRSPALSSPWGDAHAAGLALPSHV